MKKELARVWERIKREPALASAVLTAFAAVAVSFGVPLTPEQVGGLLAAFNAVLALFVVRPNVTPLVKQRQDALTE